MACPYGVGLCHSVLRSSRVCFCDLDTLYAEGLFLPEQQQHIMARRSIVCSSCASEARVVVGVDRLSDLVVYLGSALIVMQFVQCDVKASRCLTVHHNGMLAHKALNLQVFNHAMLQVQRKATAATWLTLARRQTSPTLFCSQKHAEEGRLNAMPTTPSCARCSTTLCMHDCSSARDIR